MRLLDSLAAGVSLVFLACLIVLPFVLLGLSLWCRKKRRDSLAAQAAVLFAGHSFTVALTAFLFALKGKGAPDWLYPLLPLLFTLIYLLTGAVFRKALPWIMGITTPGLWFLCQYAALAFGFKPVFLLPQDPVWYVLGGAVICGLPRIPRFAALWGDVEDAHITASGCYAMGALWLLALRQPSVLAFLKFPPYAWAVILLCFAGFLLWAARIMQDQALRACGVIGMGAGVYALIAYMTLTMLK